MTAWRKKMMPHAEWSALQDRFGEFQMSNGGNPNLALFAQSEAGEELTAIYMTGPGIDLLERVFPGGWEDAPAPSGEGVSLLVGAGDPWERFGIKR